MRVPFRIGHPIEVPAAVIFIRDGSRTGIGDRRLAPIHIIRVFGLVVVVCYEKRLAASVIGIFDTSAVILDSQYISHRIAGNSLGNAFLTRGNRKAIILICVSTAVRIGDRCHTVIAVVCKGLPVQGRRLERIGFPVYPALVIVLPVNVHESVKVHLACPDFTPQDVEVGDCRLATSLLFLFRPDGTWEDGPASADAFRIPVF